MPYIIDGHNLIPKLGLDLASPDDEMQLIEILQKYCRVRQVEMDVYFDGAQPGVLASRKFGRVKAHFIRTTSTADAAIEAQLQKLDRQARNWCVVSSDQRVQRAARDVHARVISSDGFAKEIATSGNGIIKQDKIETDLTPVDIEKWMKLFDEKKKRDLF
jgi:predicted RNA-binding protein with PIN domain